MTQQGNRVLISITGTQSSGPAQDQVEVLTTATVRQMDGVTTIDYEETSDDFPAQTFTHIRVENANVVTITRSGPHPSQLILEKGRRHLSHYDMGFGQLVMGINTSTIENTLTETNGALIVRYTMEMNHSLVSSNRLLLKILEVKKRDEKSAKRHS